MTKYVKETWDKLTPEEKEEMNQELKKILQEEFDRNFLSQKIAEELNSVQPMPSDAIKNLYEASKNEEELKAEGYEPVSEIGLVWVNKDKN